MNLTTPTVSLTNPRQGELARAVEPKLVLEWQDGPATDLGFRQQKLRLSFVRRHKPTPPTGSTPTRFACSTRAWFRERRSAGASKVHSMALEQATSH